MGVLVFQTIDNLRCNATFVLQVPVYLAEDWSDVSHEAEFWARMIESGFTALFTDQLDYIDPILLPFDMLDLTPSPLMDLVVVVSDAQPMANDHFYL